MAFQKNRRWTSTSALTEEVGLSRTDCTNLFEATLDEITDALASGDRVKITGFASFFRHQKPARTGRNPKTLEEVAILPRKVVVFRPSGVMRGRINGRAT